MTRGSDYGWFSQLSASGRRLRAPEQVNRQLDFADKHQFFGMAAADGARKHSTYIGKNTRSLSDDWKAKT